MPVNYSPTPANLLLPVAGVQLGTSAAGIKKPNHQDLTLIQLAAGSTVAGVFTRNQYCAAPVQICRENLAKGDIRALVINTGIANAGTGEDGLTAARQTCAAVAKLFDFRANQVLPFSTGVIMENLPVQRIQAGLPAAHSTLRADGWFSAAQAILTTDTVHKAASRQFKLADEQITITGMAKGAGMIKPNMATMLSFIACDAHISQPMLQRLAQEAANDSFNCITVDGDTSTNDSFILIASGEKKVEFNGIETQGWNEFKKILISLAQELAQAIVRDGEGANKFIKIITQGGYSNQECKAVAYAIAHSPLVKTAFFASDPNLGRVLAAIGNTEYPGLADLNVNKINLWLGNSEQQLLVAENGCLATDYDENAAAAIMRENEITLKVDLGRGKSSIGQLAQTHAEIYTCDLSLDYVKINADYRS